MTIKNTTQDIIKERQAVERDYTAEREKRCKEAAVEVMKILLNKKLLLSDVAFLSQLIRSKIEEVMYTLIIDNWNSIDEWIKISLEKFIEQAHYNYWGKPESEATMEDIDKALKNEYNKNQDKQ